MYQKEIVYCNRSPSIKAAPHMDLIPQIPSSSVHLDYVEIHREKENAADKKISLTYRNNKRQRFSQYDFNYL